MGTPEQCKKQFGDPWALNTKNFGHPPYDANGKVTSYSPYVWLKGAEAVALLTQMLPYLRMDKGNQKYVTACEASIAFAKANPTSLVPNPRFESKTPEFKPEEYQACING